MNELQTKNKLINDIIELCDQYMMSYEERKALAENLYCCIATRAVQDFVHKMFGTKNSEEDIAEIIANPEYWGSEYENAMEKLAEIDEAIRKAVHDDRLMLLGLGKGKCEECKILIDDFVSIYEGRYRCPLGNWDGDDYPNDNHRKQCPKVEEV